MGVVNAAVIGTAVVGGIVAKNSADKATEAASDANAASLAFEQERYDDWKETYGDIESNLSDYYGNLTPEYYESMGLQNYQQEYETNMTQMKETLAQRGIVDSGLMASLEMQGALSAAENKATIRRDSESQVMQEKSNFLQIGLGQNPADSVSNVLSNQAATATNYAQNSEVAAGQAVGSSIGTIGTTIANYYRG